jgi:hypothetical protein
MYTADTAGSDPVVTKLSLDISRRDFLSRMEFENPEEQERCLLYLDLKGVAYHVILVNFIGLDEKGRIRYKKIQNMYIYDKRLRNILYKYLSALEERIRAYISNQYREKPESIRRLSKPIYMSLSQGNSLSEQLEDLTFSRLISLTRKLTLDEKIQLFGRTDHLEDNLVAVKQLRNAVSHHRLLFVYEDFFDCHLEDGTLGNSFIDNIMNLCQLLHPYYRGYFKDAINHSCIDEEDPSFESTLPPKAIIHI